MVELDVLDEVVEVDDETPAVRQLDELLAIVAMVMTDEMDGNVLLDDDEVEVDIEQLEPNQQGRVGEERDDVDVVAI